MRVKRFGWPAFRPDPSGFGVPGLNAIVQFYAKTAFSVKAAIFCRMAIEIWGSVAGVWSNDLWGFGGLLPRKRVFRVSTFIFYVLYSLNLYIILLLFFFYFIFSFIEKKEIEAGGVLGVGNCGIKSCQNDSGFDCHLAVSRPKVWCFVILFLILLLTLLFFYLIINSKEWRNKLCRLSKGLE